MATINPTVTRISPNVVKFVWTPLTVFDSDPGAPVVEERDDGLPVPERWAEFVDRNVQVTGTAGAGFNLKIEGSRDGVTYATLNDAQGVALDITATGIKQVQEMARFMRPRISAGEIAVTSVTVTMIARRERGGQGM
jgi:hypothetical protein